MRLLAPFLFALIGGCTTIAVSLQLDQRFGPADPGRFDHPPAQSAAAPDYWKEVRPILDARCVSCHACYDAPCQLNLSSYAGITRGASARQVYSSSRLLADEPTRLGFDALSNSEWRAKGFFPVLNERVQSAEANRQGGVMYQMLALKRANPGPSNGQLLDKDIDFALDREQICARPAGIDDYTRHHPGRGMPFGLPPLADQEYATLTGWLEAGAPYSPQAQPGAAVSAQVQAWERFLNGDDKRSQLVARYIYEHWYIGHFHFPEQPEINFELVRSRTPAGQAIDVIATRRPYDDPQVARVYYRLRRAEATPVAKTYMPVELNPARLARVRDWFFAPTYVVDKLPGYQPEVASNPFATFRALPVNARYRFMLDEAQFTLMGFMKGPVCRGQVALSVINDHFWVVFLAPSEQEGALTTLLLEATEPNLGLPAAHEGAVGPLTWRNYGKQETRYLEEKARLLSQAKGGNQKFALASLWDGDGKNRNAALTVFRHFDSASVVRGLHGEWPQTVLTLGYPLFERMHYLLLAGFDVYGNVSHQLATRLYMDFLRMEGELNFLAFLPVIERKRVLDQWYRAGGEEQIVYFANAARGFVQESSEVYRTNDPLSELYQKLAKRYLPLREPNLDWQASGLASKERVQLNRLSQIKGLAAAQMPEMSLVMLRKPGAEPRVISLLSNAARSNVAQMFSEDKRRLPDEDTLLAINGVAGAYPNAIFAVDVEKLPNFVDEVSKLAQASDLIKLIEGYGIRRTDPRFWPTSDAIHAAWHKMAPREAAVLDYSRLDNL